MNRENKSLEEIKDPVKRSKLIGIQEVVFDLDEQLLEAKKQLSIKRNESHSIINVTEKILSECRKIGEELKNGMYSKEEAKVRIEQNKKVIDLLEQMKSDTIASTKTITDRITGLEDASKMVTKRFESEAQKAERHQRQEDDDRNSEKR